MNALRPLLSGIVDYAGLFPPAGLDMATAVANYAEYQADRDAWMLGRFVVPVSRLDEFAIAFTDVPVDESEWRLAALVGDDIAADVRSVDAFNARHVTRATIDTLEARLGTVSAVASAARAVEGRFALFVEIPIARDPRELVSAIAAAGVNAKVRTGGLTPDAFPSSGDIVRFMRACRDAGVQFKATAGLHHPLRSEHRLTYAPDAPRGQMYGYLNVFLTAALIGELTDDEAIALLEEGDASAIDVGRDAIRWRRFELRADQLSATRDLVASSFGSCSFREPVDELRSLSLMP